MNIINLTPHVVNVQDSEGVQSFQPTSPAARVDTRNEILDTIQGIPVSKVVYRETQNLPSPTPGTLYLVSMVVAQANPDRHDLICPDSSPTGAIRDEEGRIIAVKGFVSYAV